MNTTVSSTANNSFTNTGGVLSADTVSLSVAGDFDYVAEYLNNGTITTNALNLNVGGDFSNNDSANDFVWNANDTLTVLGSAFATVNSFTNSGYIDIANSFNVTAGYRFYNEMGAIINANDFNVTAVDRFYNWYGNATINADNFNVSAGKRFYSWTSTINANSFNLTVEEFYNEKNATLNATNNFNVTADNFTNTDGNINADIFSLSVAGDFDYVAEYLGNGTITTNTLNLNVGGDFSNNDAANDFTWGANDSLTVLGSADIATNNFANDGNISADTVSLSVAGDFDYTKKGTITTNTINLNVGGDFSNNDSANDFTWGANDSLTVLGSASVVTASFNNSGNINANSFDITAASLNNSGTISANTTLNTTVSSTVSGSFNNTGGVVSADTVSLSVAGDFDYVAEYLGNGTIANNALNLNVGGDFSNNDASSDFVWGANDTLTVLGSADITADSYTQNGAIDVTGVLTINVASDFDYVADFNGTIANNALNLNVGGDFKAYLVTTMQAMILFGEQMIHLQF